MGADTMPHPDVPVGVPGGGMTWPSSLAMLAAASFFSSLRVWSGNGPMVGRPWRLVLLGAGLWVVLFIAALILTRFGMQRRDATYVVFVAGFLFSLGGRLSERLGVAIGSAAALALIAVAVSIVLRLRSLETRTFAFRWMALFLVLNPPVQGIVSAASSPPGVELLGGSETLDLALTTSPDVFLVVFDGYPGSLALQREFQVDNATVTDELLAQGFTVPQSAWAGYSMTHASIPSLLGMSYLVPPEVEISSTMRRQLHAVIGGNNTLVKSLKAAGYHTTMIESGWGGSRCGSGIDDCVSAPIWDDAVVTALDSSLLGPLIDRLIGHGFTQGARHTMRWLVENGQRIAENDRPDLVFAHVLAPHAPYFLDAECELRSEAEYGGVSFHRPNDDAEVREAREQAFIDQIACVNGFISVFVRSIPREPIVVLVADHGSSRRDQSYRSPPRWTLADLAERMNVFLAVRVPDGCPYPSRVFLPNVLREVINCISTTPIEILEERMIIVSDSQGPEGRFPTLEVSGRLVEDLAGDAGGEHA